MHFHFRHSCIYALRDPITNAIRYIGKTSEPKLRYRKHKANCGSTNLPLSQYLSLLHIIGKEPRMHILMYSLHDHANKDERRIIKAVVESGGDLLNVQCNPQRIVATQKGTAR